MGAVDVISQMYNKGMCYCQRAKRLRRRPGVDARPIPPPTENDEALCYGPSEAFGIAPTKWNDFEIDLARTLKTATATAVLAPAAYGVTLFFVISPVQYLSNALSAAGVTAACATPYIYYSMKPNMTAQDLRYYLIPTMVSVSAATFATSYLLGSVIYHHRILVWPMISSLGELPPESLFYTTGMALTSVMYAMTVNALGVSRKEFNHEDQATTRNLGLRCGYLAALGLLTVSICPSIPGSATAYPHYIGAGLFLMGNIPFFVMLQATEPDLPEGQPLPGNRMYRIFLLSAYTAGAIAYPVLWQTYKIPAAIMETSAALSWWLLMVSYDEEVRGSAAIQVTGREVYLTTEEDEEKPSDGAKMPFTKKNAPEVPAAPTASSWFSKSEPAKPPAPGQADYSKTMDIDD